MKSAVLIILMASAGALTVFAQNPSVPVQSVSVAPSGNCSGSRISYLTPNGTLYTCQNGTWGTSGSSIASTALPLKGNSAGGAVAAAAADIVGLFSSCTGTKVLAADGTCITTSGSPGGSDTQVQVNSAGAFVGSAALTFPNLAGGTNTHADLQATFTRGVNDQGYGYNATANITDVAGGAGPSFIPDYVTLNYTATNSTAAVHMLAHTGRIVYDGSAGSTVAKFDSYYADMEARINGAALYIGYDMPAVIVAAGKTVAKIYGGAAFLEQGALSGTSTNNVGWLSAAPVAGMTNYAGFVCCIGPQAGTFAANYNGGVTSQYPVHIGWGSQLLFDNLGGVKQSASGTDSWINAGDWASSSYVAESGAANAVFINGQVQDFSGSSKASVGFISGWTSVGNVETITDAFGVKMRVGSTFSGAGATYTNVAIFDAYGSGFDTTTNLYGFRFNGTAAHTGGTVGTIYGLYMSALYEGSITHTNRSYGLYQADTANVDNYFGGRLGIGKTRPATALEVDSGSTTTVGITLDSLIQFAGQNTTAAVAGVIGATCPAVTCTAAYTWVRVVTADGSTAYMPVWK